MSHFNATGGDIIVTFSVYGVSYYLNNDTGVLICLASVQGPTIIQWTRTTLYPALMRSTSSVH